MTTTTKPAEGTATGPQDEEKGDLWDHYRVKLHFPGHIYGGVPMDPKLIEGWVRAQGAGPMEAKAIADKEAAQVRPPTQEEVDEAAERMWTTFRSDERGLYVGAYQVKAMLKEAVGESELWKKVFGLKSRVAGQVFPKGQGGPSRERIYLTRNGAPLTKPDGREDSAGHVKGPRGERSILKRRDFMADVDIEFELLVGGETVKEDTLRFLLSFSAESGLGADRSMEQGKFEVAEFVRVAKRDKVALPKAAAKEAPSA